MSAERSPFKIGRALTVVTMLAAVSACVTPDHQAPAQTAAATGDRFSLAENCVFAFNFVLQDQDLTPAEQVRLLADLGYDGIALAATPSRPLADIRSLAEAAEAESGFSLTAVYAPLQLSAETLDERIAWARDVIDISAPAGARFWPTIRADAADRAAAISFLRAAAEYASKRDVEVVYYPHDRHLIQSAEPARDLIEEVGHDNLSVSLHLNHEIRAGNGARVGEVARAVAPRIGMASVSGADNHYTDESRDWSDVVKPLGEGDYDVRQVLDALGAVGYRGPIGVQNFGVPGDPAEHLARSRAWLYETTGGELGGRCVEASRRGENDT